MAQLQPQETFRTEVARNGRCTFTFGKLQRDDLVRTLSAQIKEAPSRLPENTPYLIDRLKSGAPLSQGDLHHIVRLHPQLQNLGVSTDAAVKAASRKLDELALRHQQKFSILRASQYKGTQG